MHITDSDLNKAGFGEIRPGVWAREGEAALLERLAGADLFVSDFDECMHPAITQAEAGIAIYKRVASSMLDPRHMKLYLNMSLFAGPILSIKLYQKITGNIQNSRMIGFFEKMARGIPSLYFEEAAGPLAEKFFPGVADTLRLLNRRRVPAGVISLGLDVIIEEMLRLMEEKKNARADFFDCTRVELDSRGCFRRFEPGHAYYNNEDKRRLLGARVKKLRAKRPIIVGHDRDDMMMFDEAKKLGGMTLGFRPMPETLQLLDVAVAAEDWMPIYGLLKDSYRITPRRAAE